MATQAFAHDEQREKMLLQPRQEFPLTCSAVFQEKYNSSGRSKSTDLPIMGLQIVARLKPATATACTVVKVSQGGLGNEAKATASIGLSNSECPLASSMSAGERHPLLVPAKSNATLRPANLQGWKPCVWEKLRE